MKNWSFPVYLSAQSPVKKDLTRQDIKLIQELIPLMSELIPFHEEPKKQPSLALEGAIKDWLKKSEKCSFTALKRALKYQDYPRAIYLIQRQIAEEPHRFRTLITTDFDRGLALEVLQNLVCRTPPSLEVESFVNTELRRLGLFSGSSNYRVILLKVRSIKFTSHSTEHVIVDV